MTPEDIIRARFRRTIGGYRRDEVHAFLAEVALHFERAGTQAMTPSEVAGAVRALADELSRADEAPAPPSRRRPAPVADEVDPRSGLPRTPAERRSDPKLHAVRSRRANDPAAVIASVPEVDAATRMVTIEVRSGETSMIAAPADVTTAVVDHDMYCVSVYRGERLIATGHFDDVDDAPDADDDATRTA